MYDQDSKEIATDTRRFWIAIAASFSLVIFIAIFLRGDLGLFRLALTAIAVFIEVEILW